MMVVDEKRSEHRIAFGWPLFKCSPLIFSCKKENPVLSGYENILKGIDLEKLSDNEKLEYFSKIQYKDFSLFNFNISKINDKEISKNINSKVDFSKDKIYFNARINFSDKTKFYNISNYKIEISDSKKDEFLSTNDNRYYISGYFKNGKFYFTQLKKLGFQIDIIIYLYQCIQIGYRNINKNKRYKNDNRISHL